MYRKGSDKKQKELVKSALDEHFTTDIADRVNVLDLQTNCTNSELLKEINVIKGDLKKNGRRDMIVRVLIGAIVLYELGIVQQIYAGEYGFSLLEIFKLFLQIFI